MGRDSMSLPMALKELQEAAKFGSDVILSKVRQRKHSDGRGAFCFLHFGLTN